MALNHQNRTFYQKLWITKKNHAFNQESFKKSVFKAEKQKNIFFTLQLYNGTKKPYLYFAYGLTLGRTTVPPTKKLYVYGQSHTLDNTEHPFFFNFSLISWIKAGPSTPKVKFTNNFQSYFNDLNTN